MSTGKLDFFDPDKARGPREGPDVGGEPSDAPAPRAVSVSALVARIKGALLKEFDSPVQVVGEISNLKFHSSGHVYFRLKDADAAIDAVMFRSAASRMKFRPADGMEVVAEGRVDVYDVRGQLQVYVERLTPKGAGALELAFRQLREKIEREGLFAPEHKKPIPRFPRAIGVVTSATGAAVRDIRRTLLRRWPGAKVYLLPSLVQGEGAAEQLAESVGLLDAAAEALEIDTIIIARGGGSMEDLWAFNEEVLARAVFAARTPIISGVGHEVDVTICDLVADARAATPTAAAETAAPNAEDVRRTLEDLSQRLRRCVAEGVKQANLALASLLRSVVFRDPSARLRTRIQRLDELAYKLRTGVRHRLSEDRRRVEPADRRLAALHPARLADRAGADLREATHRLAWVLDGRRRREAERLAVVSRRLAEAHPRHRLKLARQRLDAAARQLESMSHRSVLKRGFSVTRRADGTIIRSTGQANAGECVETEVSDGRFTSTVDGDDAPTPRRAAPRRKPKADPDQPGLFE